MKSGCCRKVFLSGNNRFFYALRFLGSTGGICKGNQTVLKILGPATAFTGSDQTGSEGS